MNKADVLKDMRPHEALLLIKAVGLRRRHEEILIMRYVDDMSCYDIADKLNIEVESVRNRVVKARKEFSKHAEV